MTKPFVATILEDGTYGQREMTDQEYADYLFTVSNMTIPNHPPANIFIPEQQN